MNRLIFDTLTFLNGLIAVLLIVVSGYIGSAMPLFNSARPMGAVLGALTGLILAAVICGSLAFFALVERHLRTIAERPPVAGGSNGYASVAPGRDGAFRQEPRL